MKIYCSQKIRSFALIGYLFTFAFAYGQNDPLTLEITTWFQEERFIIADQNEDALLEREEMEVFSTEYSYFLNSRHFEIADKNQDGYLSFNEIHAKRKSENIFRYHQERKQLRELARKHPMLAQADAKYLKQHPQLVEELFGNFVWLAENQEEAEKIYKDKRWTNTNSRVLVSLHRNLRWMAANPSEAANLYKNKQATNLLPELLGWRADHRLFIRQHPKIDRFYQESFIPGGMR